ncbi:MAG TPA: Xaa-Pro dipeptidyl-peptidase [Candidatus Tetragenococcus pullicola]|nr:Xaa-Pro dipeptidyl-peptidase [Candidatus Tetragenococcus pullicola]
MKINQFSRVDESTSQQIEELTRIGFLKNNEAKVLNVNDLWCTFLRRSFPLAKSETTKNYRVGLLLASPTQNVWEYLENHTVDAKSFYNVALQLLGFTCGDDFDVAQPLKAMTDLNLHYKETITNTEELINAWYDLLNTRGAYGQVLLDHLAGQGFFVPLYELPVDQRPLLFNGKSQPIYDTDKLIREVVYIETDLDSDHDGQRDLIKAEISRPQDTKAGLKIPAVYTSSPYGQGTNDATSDQLMHTVDVPLTRKEPNSVTYDDLKPQENKTPVPAERTPLGTSQESEESFSREASYTLNDYLLARGFATVYAAGIGTRDSDGVRTCGSREETASVIAVIEWLAGNRRAFTNRTDNIEIKAWWCNGSVAMTGISYLGTNSMAAATSGVKGLKTVITEAGIPNWYDYYRDGGLVIAPGGYPGEDMDVLADLCFSRQKLGADNLKIKPFFDQLLKQLKNDQDRTTGNYTTFWNERNYLNNIQNVTCDVIMVHGLNDWNVKLRTVYSFYQALKQVPVTKKLILHQGQHIYINDWQSLDFTEMMNLWLTHKLYDVENGAKEILPDVLVQDNTQEQTWHTYPDWESSQVETKTLALSENKLSETKSGTDLTLHFSDHLPEKESTNYKKDVTTWEKDLLIDSKTPVTNNRLLFKTDPLEKDVLLRGAATLKVNVASALDHGLLSVMLVDYGKEKRLGANPTPVGKEKLQLGYHWREMSLREFKLTKETPWKMITKGHINLQNRHNTWQVDDLKAHEFYEFSFDLQPSFYHLLAGHQLGLVIYATDMGMTVRGNEENEYALKLADCHLQIKTSDY